MTRQGGPYTRFRRSLNGGSMLIIRATAAELPRIGVAEAAAILLAIERLEPENYERAARRWLAKLCEERNSSLDLLGVAQAAAALDALPTRRPAACAALAAVCERVLGQLKVDYVSELGGECEEEPAGSSIVCSSDWPATATSRAVRA